MRKRGGREEHNVKPGPGFLRMPGSALPSRDHRAVLNERTQAVESIERVLKTLQETFAGEEAIRRRHTENLGRNLEALTTRLSHLKTHFSLSPSQQETIGQIERAVEERNGEGIKKLLGELTCLLKYERQD